MIKEKVTNSMKVNYSPQVQTLNLNQAFAHINN